MDGDADLVGKQRGELEGEGAKHAWNDLELRSARVPFVSYIRSFNFLWRRKRTT
jgi:hypothetical protein